jgi:hypothetical protein
MSDLRNVLFVVAMTIAAVPAGSEPQPGPPDEPITAAAVPFGARTRAWLVLQRQVVPERPARPLPAEAQSRAFERYLQSFTHPIPERFELDRLDANRR